MSVRYDGDNYREHLKLLLEDRRLLQKDFAKLMGRSPAWASQILSGRRSLQRDGAERIAEVLKLDDIERWDLLHLVDRAASPTPTQRRAGSEEPATLDRWYVSAILELTGCDGYQPDPEWVAAELRPRITPDEAREALELLAARELLAPDHRLVPGRIIEPRRGIHAADAGAKASLEIALDALDRFPPNVRQHVVAHVALSEEGYVRFLTRARQLLADTLRAADDEEDPNRVYQVALTAFPVTLYTDAALHPKDVDD